MTQWSDKLPALPLPEFIRKKNPIKSLAFIRVIPLSHQIPVSSQVLSAIITSIVLWLYSVFWQYLQFSFQSFDPIAIKNKTVKSTQFLQNKKNIETNHEKEARAGCNIPERPIKKAELVCSPHKDPPVPLYSTLGLARSSPHWLTIWVQPYWPVSLLSCS